MIIVSTFKAGSKLSKRARTNRNGQLV